MRILMVHPHDIHSPLEPWTIRVRALAGELTDRGHEVRLVYHVLDPTVPLEVAYKRQEYPFETIPMIRHNVTLISKTKALKRLADWADIVHFQKCLAYAAIPALGAAYLAGKPVHYDWDDWEFGIYNYRPLSRVVGFGMDLLERVLPRLVNTMTLASDRLTEMAHERGGRPDRCFPGHVGADLTRFHPEVDGSRVRAEHHLEGPILLYLGQLHGAQYAELFIDAAAELARRRPEARFMVVGDGGRFGEIHARAEQLGVADRVVFTGAVPYDRVPEYIAAADVAVATFADTPQVRCKSPLKVVEYLAAGKAIVASRVGEVARMLEGGCGELVAPGDAGAIVSACEKLLDSPELRTEMGRRARRRAEQKYNWSVTAEHLLQAYTVALELHHQRSLAMTPPLREVVQGKNGLAGAEEEAAVPAPPAPTSRPSLLPSILTRPVEEVRQYLHRNLDLVGVLDGQRAFVGPDTLQIDPTNNCNNDCIACWCHSPLLADMKMPPEIRVQTIPLSHLKRVVDEAADMGTREIYLAGGGDPMMHPNIMEFLEHIKKRGLDCSVNTNFTLATPERARRMVEMGIDHLTISAWAASPEVYARTHPNKAEETFERFKETLLSLYYAKMDAGVSKPYVKVYHVLSKINFHEIEEMIDFTKAVGAESVEFTPLDTMPDRTDYLLLSEDERVWLYHRCLEIEERRGGIDVPGEPFLYGWEQFVRRISTSDTIVGEHDRNIIETIPCTVGWSFARIMADGAINFCLKSHRIPMGNIYRQSFKEVWHSAQQKQYRAIANTYLKDDPFFSMIGNDPSARIGCYKGCDDLGRNIWIDRRLKHLNLAKRTLLRGAGIYYRMRGRKYWQGRMVPETHSPQ